jgi:outer membrane protein assembly factor BamA
MRIPIRLLLFSLLATAGPPQQPCSSDPPEDNTRINKLVLDSSTLPDPDRKRIITRFQQKAYPQPEIADRIRQALRDLGYFNASILSSEFSFTPQTGKAANVTVTVEPGSQYRLGEIHFHNATIFLPAQLRQLFAQQPGNPFNVTRFSVGLDNMRKLYATRGYVNTVVFLVVKMDESNHLIHLILEVNEGEPYSFGHLYLEGVEPHPGSSKLLMASWKPLEGKRYNSTELEKWYLANRSTWRALPQFWQAIKFTPQPDHTMNVTLTQWCP